MNGTGRHIAEAVGGGAVASSYLWITSIEEPLRLALLIGGLVLTALQIALALRTMRRGRR